MVHIFEARDLGLQSLNRQLTNFVLSMANIFYYQTANSTRGDTITAQHSVASHYAVLGQVTKSIPCTSYTMNF